MFKQEASQQFALLLKRLFIELKSSNWQKISCKFLQIALVDIAVLHYFKANRYNAFNDYLKQCVVGHHARFNSRTTTKA
jgi:hypothetical protein